MKVIIEPQTASAIHAYSLVVLGIWGHYDGDKLLTVIAVFSGVVLLVMNNGVRYLSRVHTNVALVVTFVTIVGLGYMLAQSDVALTTLVRDSLLLLLGIWSAVCIGMAMKNKKPS